MPVMNGLEVYRVLREIRPYIKVIMMTGYRQEVQDLKEEGYQTETAKTGMKAIAKAKVYPFDIALLDIGLPDMLGIEVLRTLRKEQPVMMIIMITAHATLTTAVDALNLGANAFIMKPIDPEILDKTIKR